ncbi:hypothetical protein KAR91_39465 [Candidatus Pacearchaeota archaeon]|nr:hypothetical protein [Candidatus Pacearchaeota archaeon]
MDTSEAYVKMCREAKEIQEKWKVDEGDWCIDKSKIPKKDYHVRWDEYGVGVIDADQETNSNKCRISWRKWVLWLPRQDQLQEILLESINKNREPEDEADHITILDNISEWVFSKPYPTYQSMEQLWLAFVMKKKHQKTWNGETWT